MIIDESINSDNEDQIQIIKVDLNGDLEWETSFSSDDSSDPSPFWGNVDYDLGHFVIQMSDGNYIAVGNSHNRDLPEANATKVILLKLDSEGNIIYE